ncbi:MAG: hypothetical protein R2752_16270 [Vicinamibacterales bacterium]
MAPDSVLASPPAVCYAIDAADRLSTVDDGWAAFAKANDGAHLLPPGIIGRSLWDAISDHTTRDLYREMVDRVRRGLGPIALTFSCDAPGERRRLHLRMVAGERGAVAFEVRMHTHARAPQRLLDVHARRAGALVEMCSWCKRVVGPGKRWLPVEEAVEALALFTQASLPPLTHGICPDCYDLVLATLRESDPKDS